MAGIRKSLLQFIFSGSFMKRWNDKLRPTELSEVDKQAHKMLVAWFLCRLHAENAGGGAEQLALEQKVVEGGLFEYCFRLVITDIKPPVFYRIKENPDHYRKLTEWVLKELEPQMQSLDEVFWERLQAYFLRSAAPDLADAILEAAHHYASYWEFRLLKPLNSFDDELQEIEAGFQSKLEGLRHVRGVAELIDVESNSIIRGFANLCGQLRFQKRWSQTPRIPETSVLGHMFVVAAFAYFFSICVGACRGRCVNNFIAGLLHDLPEVLTRDIIFPVKTSVGGMDTLIRAYEEEALHRKILAPLRKEGYGAVADRLEYYLGLAVGSEFHECICRDGRTERVSFDDLQARYNADIFDPKDGRLLKACDGMGAFLEAYTAVRNGIASDHLQQALWRLREDNRHFSLGPLHVGALFADFD